MALLTLASFVLAVAGAESKSGSSGEQRNDAGGSNAPTPAAQFKVSAERRPYADEEGRQRGQNRSTLGKWVEAMGTVSFVGEYSERIVNGPWDLPSPPGNPARSTAMSLGGAVPGQILLGRRCVSNCWLESLRHRLKTDPGRSRRSGTESDTESDR
jgi:hypothetical protein